MPLDLPDGSRCFVDSNILYYALVPTIDVSQRCIEFMERAIAGRVSLSVSVSVLSDALHKVMISEAAQLANRDRAGIVGYLNKHPEIISKLVEYPKALDRLTIVPMDTLPVDTSLLIAATRLACQYRLLTNDAMIVALMQRRQLVNLISNDDDFDGVPGITVYKPR